MRCQIASMSSASLPDQVRHLAAQDVGDRAAIAPDRIGVAGTFGAVGVADAHGDQLEGGDCAVRSVGRE